MNGYTLKGVWYFGLRKAEIMFGTLDNAIEHAKYQITEGDDFWPIEIIGPSGKTVMDEAALHSELARRQPWPRP